MSVAFGPDGDRAPSAKIRAQRESASGGKTAILIEPAQLATALAERRRKDSRCSETALARRAFYLLYRDATKRFRRLVGTVDRASSGHEVRIVTAPPYYPEWRTPKAFRGWRYRREITKGEQSQGRPSMFPAIRRAPNVSFITPRLHFRARFRSSPMLFDGGRTSSSRLLPRSCRLPCLPG